MLNTGRQAHTPQLGYDLNTHTINLLVPRWQLTPCCHSISSHPMTQQTLRQPQRFTKSMRWFSAEHRVVSAADKALKMLFRHHIPQSI